MPELDAPIDETTEVELSLPALLPDDYVPDVHARLILYKRIASARNSEEIRELKVELIDRFGLLPEPTKTLFDVTELKLRCAGLGITRVEGNAAGGRILFNENPAIDTMALLTMIQTEPKTYKFDGKTTLRFAVSTETPEERIEFIDQTLQRLAVKEAGS